VVVLPKKTMVVLPNKKGDFAKQKKQWWFCQKKKSPKKQ